MNPIIKEITPTLEKLFEEYSSKGMHAVYLWGSVTTPDFNMATSDVDTVAIVDESFNVSMERVIQANLQSLHPNIKKFGFRIIYIEELKQGKQLKSVLASYIIPRFFIFDLPNWVHIAGKKFVPGDFTHMIPTVKEMLRARVDEIESRGWGDASAIEDAKAEYYVKCLWRVAHLLQLQKENTTGPFSYTSVIANANAGEKIIIEILRDLKSSGYAYDRFLKNAPSLTAFVEDVKKRV